MIHLSSILMNENIVLFSLGFSRQSCEDMNILFEYEYVDIAFIDDVLI